MVSHYKINIALNGKHWAKITLDQHDEAKAKFEELLTRFPASEGWHLMLYFWEVNGKYIA